MKMTNKKRYCIPNRLADVFALIQVLAFDGKAKRSVNGIESELQGKPKSAVSWKDVVLEHPEFFRFNKKEYAAVGDDGNVICLIVRHVKNEVLTSDMTTKFFETAIKLHDKEQERADSWKSWLPLLVAIITVLSSFYIQYASNQSQKYLTHYEVELKPKQESYANYMRSLSQAYYAAQAHNSEQMVLSLGQAENYFYIFEPFLSTYDRDKLWKQYQRFNDLCYSMVQNDSKRKNPANSAKLFLWYKNYFRTNLYDALFNSDK
jgi:hypothetical protein